jgi:hypothetical protein
MQLRPRIWVMLCFLPDLLSMHPSGGSSGRPQGATKPMHCYISAFQPIPIRGLSSVVDGGDSVLSYLDPHKEEERDPSAERPSQ